jgi:glycosyl transferase family 87
MLRNPSGRWLHGGIMAVLLAVVVSRLLMSALREPDFGVAFDADGGGWSSDFAAHLTFAKAFWSGTAGYDVQSHLRITGARFGRPVQHALPFGYSPTMLWVLAPLCLAPPAWAYVVWTLLGVAAVWWMTRPQWAIWITAALFSPTAFTCFKLGQTGFLTAAGLLFLMMRDLEAQATPTPARAATSDWLDVMVFWALTAKPPMALTAGVVLVAGRRWRTVLLGFGLSVLTSLVLTPLLGTDWMREYLHLITHYNLDAADPAYVWSLKPQTMGNLRALLHVTGAIRDSLASGWSNALWVLAGAGIVAGGLRRRLPTEAAWGFAVLAYLLFCPHVTSTEELHLVLLLALVGLASRPVSGAVRWATVALVLTALYLPPGIGYQGPLRLPAVFAAKLLLAALLWVQWMRPQPQSLPSRPASACLASPHQRLFSSGAS